MHAGFYVAYALWGGAALAVVVAIVVLAEFASASSKPLAGKTACSAPSDLEGPFGRSNPMVK